MIKAVLFDLDATLMDSRELYNQAYALAFREVLGVELSHEDRIRFMRLPTTDFLAMYAQGEQHTLLETCMKTHVDRLIPQARLFSGAEQVLEALKAAGICLGVVTSQNGGEMAVSREVLQLDRLIDAWVSVDDVDNPKPHPDPVLEALRRVGVVADQAVMVGDSLWDLQSGRAAGALTGAALWDALDPQEMLAFEPDFVFKQPDDVLSLIRS